MGGVSIDKLINQSLSLQVMDDYVNWRWFFTSVAQVALQRHLLINSDLSDPIVLIVTLLTDAAPWYTV